MKTFTTAGMRTSEFYLTVLTLVAVAVMEHLGTPSDSFITLAKFLIPGFALSRGIAKNAPAAWPEVDVEVTAPPAPGAV